jgi:cytochrome oxidase assembly protein ShyY1
MTALTLLGVVLFILLGRWQWHRAGESQALQQAFLRGSGSRTDLSHVSAAALPRYSGAQARGRYDSAHQFLLENISHAGMPGYDVLTPLQLADGRTLIVNRGWIPLTESRHDLPDVGVTAAPDSEAYGRLDHLPLPGISLGHAPPLQAAPWPKLTSFPTMTDLSAALGRPLESRQLLLDARAPFGYVRDWQPPGMSPAQHYSYAIQWWAFAAVAVVLYGALNRSGRPRPVVRSRTGAGGGLA